MSAEPTFTRGPWHPGHLGSDSTCQCANVVDEEFPGGICTVHIDNGKRIGEDGNGAPPRAQAIGNMHLIAAAPDLFHALNAVVRVADRNTVEFRVARAALSKALGGAI